MTAKTSLPAISPIDYCTWAFAVIAMVLVLKLHLLPALFSGLVVYELAHVLVRVIQRRLISRRSSARLLAITVLAIIIAGLVTLLIIGIVAFLRSGSGSIPVLMQKLAEIVDGSRAMLPATLWEYLPSDAEEMRATLVEWLRENAGVVQNAGKQAGHTAAQMLIGMVVGGLLSLVDSTSPADQKPLAKALTERASRLHLSFRRIVLAQGRIAAINASLTWLYLGVALPLIGVDLPLVKTMILITFVAGLLPVIGNLISNTIIVIISLSYALYMAFASLIFLISIHKLEYFLNARIIGSRIRANAWEMLVAMLVMEAAFGIAGLVAAPLYYAYIKDELSAKELV